MRKIDIEAVKYQCRIEHDEEDLLIDGYIKSAYDHVSAWLNRSLHDYDVPADDKDGLVINASINQACLMLVAHWYANREAVANNMVNLAVMPLGVQALLQPYRLMGV